MKQKNLINWLGLLGVVSFVSYLAAVVLSPLAYPGYDWKSRAVSDLSAANAPSLALWNQLSCLYGVCGIVCIMAACIAVGGKLNKPMRMGVYIWSVMEWIAAVGYPLFPLSEAGGNGRAFQDIMHGYVVTTAVVLLSIISLVLIIIGGYYKKSEVTLAVFAIISLILMFVGAIGTGVAPKEYFGILQRFSNVISANGFNMVLGLYLFNGKFDGCVKDPSLVKNRIKMPTNPVIPRQYRKGHMLV